jgi:hypothetical protein
VKRNLKIVRYLIFLSFYLVFFSSLSGGAELTGPEVTLKNNEMFVTTSLVLDDKYAHEIRDGIEKELVFYIDLFRVWDMWPDEFILGKSITRTIKCDPVKSEFVATSFDGNTFIEKRFKSLESLTTWVLSIEELKLTNIRELEPGTHFVKITAASKIRKLPPLIGPFIIFLSENEFKISKESPHFRLRPMQ